MKNIDFLPTAYRERNALRGARAWWGIVVLVFGTVILTTASVQFTWRRAVERQLEAIESQFMAAKQRDLELNQLQKQIQNAGEEAGLYTYLGHPWPKSQIIAAVVEPLSESITLHQIHVTEEAMVVRTDEPVSSGKRRTASKEKEEAKLSPALQDLARLRQDCDNRRTVVAITGMTSDVRSLHHFVTELGKSPIVASAQLKSLEAVSVEPTDLSAIVDGNKAPTARQSAGTRFEVQLVVVPGYGQPGGPQPKNSPETSTAAYSPHAALVGGPQ